MRPLVITLVITLVGIVAALSLRATLVEAPAEVAVGKLAAVSFGAAEDPFTVDWERAEREITRAASLGARYVVLPEMVLGGGARGEFLGGLERAETIPGATTQHFGKLARRLGLWIVFSMPEKAPGGEGYFVTTVLLDSRGEVLYRHRKVSRLIGGDSAALTGSPRAPMDTFDDHGLRIGVLNGDDIRIGVPRLAARGAHTILISSGWTTRDPVDPIALCRTLSQRYGVRLVVANRTSLADEDGHSARVRIFDPQRIHRPLSAARRGDEVLDEVLLVAQPIPRRDWDLTVPLGLPALPVPSDQPLTPAIVELGGELFSDPALSSTGQVSCATCHRPELAFANGEATGEGVHGRRTQRNVPSLLNVAFKGSLFWDGGVSTLEAQAKYPMTSANEMDFHYLDQAVAYVRNKPYYVQKFRSAMGEGEIEFEHIAGALAGFQRTLLSADSAFDRFYFASDPHALSTTAQHGFELFRGKAGCVACHAIGENSALFMDGDSHNTGVGFEPEDGAFADSGAGLMEPQTGLFVTPSLRDVALSPPYMHDGSLATLEEVVAFYNRGGGSNPHLDSKIKALDLSPEESGQLVAFLHALTGENELPGAAKQGLTSSSRGEGVRAAALGFAPLAGRREETRRLLTGRVRMAAQSGAGLVVLPEYAEIGSPNGTASQREALLQAAQDWQGSREFFSALAARYGIWLAVSLPEPGSSPDNMFLTAVLFDSSGREVVRNRKIEPRPKRGEGFLEAGNLEELEVAEHPSGRIAVLSGDDISVGVERLAELGASTLLISASWHSADRIDWLDRCARLAQRFAVNLVVSNLDRPAEEEPQISSASLRFEAPGSVAVDSSGFAQEVLFADLEPAVESFDMVVPLGLSRLPQPPYNQLTEAKVALGRKLFFDPSLSSDNTVSCASCHIPEQAFSNGATVAIGVHGRPGRLNVPSLWNVAYRRLLSWEGQIRTLEDQIRHALLGWFEMNSTVENALVYLRGQSQYREEFRQVTGRDEITFHDVEMCIASFGRTLLSANSPFDRHYFNGESSALSAGAQRGFDLFVGKAGCAKCHQLGETSALFTDQKLHNTGVGYHPRFDYLGYKGDGLSANLATKNSFRGEYFTPSLRNIALTAPYMHDGSIKTLEEVVEFYDRGGLPNPFLDPAVKPLALGERDKQDLVEFLGSLTGELPNRPPSANLVAEVNGGK